MFLSAKDVWVILYLVNELVFVYGFFGLSRVVYMEDFVNTIFLLLYKPATLFPHPIQHLNNLLVFCVNWLS